MVNIRLPKRLGQGLVIILGILIGLVILPSFWATIFGLIWLIICAYSLGYKLTNENNGPHIILGLVAIFCLVGIVGAIMYHLADIGFVPRLIIILLITFLSAWWLTDSNWKLPSVKINKNLYWTAAYLFFTALSFIQLFRHQTVEAIRSPWEVLPTSFWILITISTGLLIYIFFYQRPSLTLLVIHSLLFYSVAAMVYTLGYGYDPFIHLATEKYIAAKDFITPKKLYYLGQYVPIVILAKNLGWSLELVNRWLTPVLASLVIPACTWLLMQKNNRPQLAPTVLAIPFTWFIMTTPQNLANLFFMAAAILALTSVKYHKIIWLLALSALATQPIAGLPLVAWAMLVSSQNLINKKLKLGLMIFGIITGLFGLMASFWLLGQTSIFKPVVQLASFPWVILQPYTWSLKLTGNITDVAYFYSSILIILLGLLWLFAFRKMHLDKLSARPIIIMTGILIANIIIFSSFITFPFLIDYERNDFAKRLVEIVILLTTPLVLLGLSKLIIKPRSWVAIVLTICLLSSFYLSYPRNDKHFYTKGFSVSQADVEAVNKIEQDANGKPYLVLANQNLGAAALDTFGFIRYYLGPDNREQFFYSIPTGDRLYKYFYNIAEKNEPILTNITAAGQDFKTDLVYLVINNYWWSKDKIKDQALPLADKVLNINNKILVYRFSIKQL